MILADVLLYTLVIVGSYFVIVCYWLLAAALFPGLVERCQAQYSDHPWRASLVGFVVWVPLLMLSTVLGKVPNPGAKILALALLLIAAVLALFGSAGLARRVGIGLPTMRDEQEPWRRVWRGGLVLGLTFIMPFLGWFLVLPWTLMSGLGAFLLSRPKRASAPVAEPPAVPVAQ
ncbi:MAG: hypothetical protein M3463_14540 [Verrucomicrobiota bacterium]|nr:hypothetical protein [Verrucomicrobiota bacterium]